MTSEQDANELDAHEEREALCVSKREKRFEVVAGYQASLWDGVQSSNYTQASAARTQAAQFRTEANQFRLADLGVFENYVDATIDGDDELASFYSDRFRPEFIPAFEAWEALDAFNDPSAPPSPLAMPEYQLDADEQATALEVRATTLFIEGEDANTYSDVYTMSTLLFAIVLFFAAISERFDYVCVRVLSLAAVGLVAGISVDRPVYRAANMGTVVREDEIPSSES